MTFLKKLSIALVVFVVFLGCVSNKTVSQNELVRLSIENTSEGVLFFFDDIPPNIGRVFIHLAEYWENPVQTFTDIVPIVTDIKGIQLEQLKRTNTIICPFVQKGHSYFISVTFEDNNGTVVNNFETEFIPNNGIHILNELSVTLNDTNTSIRLSAEPVFSADVNYISPKYSYTVTVEDTNSLISYGKAFDNESEWDYFTEMPDALKKEVQTAGNLPAFATAYCRINYKNIIWEVGIAKSAEFTISL